MFLRLLALAAALCCLYFFNLAGTGLLGPDEPRYASIGREMARSGDWTTPRLWGEPWFEKPALLYWMIGVAFRLGLNENLAPRLPVALLSCAFLIFYFWILRREFGPRPAMLATVVLATSAGWLGFSHVGVTDLPLAAFFSAAMLLSLDWLRSGSRRLLPWAAACLGLAVLSKGLIPIVLMLPLIWYGRRRFVDLLRPPVLLSLLLVAAPWYVLVYARHGAPFLETFILEHHLGRFASEALQHVQPLWFYLPVLAGALFPWTPALVLLFRRSLYSDPRRVFLLAWLLFGLVFLSIATNKLPGYILPLVPAAAALTGLALDEARDRRWVLCASAVLLCLVVPLADVLPQALAGGLSRATWPAFRLFWLLPVVLAVPLWRFAQRPAAVASLAAAVVVAVIYLKVAAFPRLDALASARPVWRQVAAVRESACVDDIHRNFRYGLNYYSTVPLPGCDVDPRATRVTQAVGQPPGIAR